MGSDPFFQVLVFEGGDLVVNGDPRHRLPNNLNVSIPWIDGEALLLSLEDVAVSSGSACRSSAPGGSHVMNAIGRDDELARSTIRIGLGRWTTEEEIDYAIGRVTETVARLRSMSSIAEMSAAATSSAASDTSSWSGAVRSTVTDWSPSSTFSDQKIDPSGPDSRSPK